MLWLDKQKTKIANKLKSNYTQTQHHISQLQIPLTNMERLENWIKLGLWLILSLILLLLINLGLAVFTGLYATVMVVIFWLKGWDPIAHKLAQYWQKRSLAEEAIDPQLARHSRTIIAEQRLLNILTITTDWQSLTSAERSLKTLHVLDAVYRIAVGLSPTAITNAIIAKAASVPTDTN